MYGFNLLRTKVLKKNFKKLKHRFTLNSIDNFNEHLGVYIFRMLYISAIQIHKELLVGKEILV